MRNQKTVTEFKNVFSRFISTLDRDKEWTMEFEDMSVETL